MFLLISFNSFLISSSDFVRTTFSPLKIESLSIKSGISVELVKSYFSGQYDSPSWNSSMKTWPEHVEALKKNVDGTCWFKYEHQAKDSLEDSFKEFIKSAPDLLVPYIDKEKWLKTIMKF